MFVPILEISHISKEFHPRNVREPAIDDISLKLEENDRLALFGPSGSGKTTLARVLKGIIKPTNGKILFEGKLQTSKTLLMNPEIQLIFQNPYESLTPKVQVKQLLLEPLTYLFKLSKDKAFKKVYSFCEELEIQLPLLEKYSYQLSGGERQRVALLRALLANPKVLICDEILSALDQPLQNEVLDLLINFQKRHSLAIIFITHDLSLIQSFSKTVLLLNEGKVWGPLPTTNLLANHDHPFIRSSFEAANWLQST